MVDTSSLQSSATPTAPVNAGQVFSWIGSGWRLVRDEKAVWLGMALVYCFIAVALRLIPFMGNLVLILITPMLLGGALFVARDQVGGVAAPSIASPSTWQTWRHIYILDPARRLFQVFSLEQKIFDAVILSITILGLVMLVKIAGYLLVGGSMVSGLTAAELQAPRISLLFRILVVSLLHVALAMGLFYSVPLVLLGNRPPLLAIIESFSVCTRNVWPVSLFTSALVIPYAAIWLGFQTSLWFGYLLLIGVGLIALAVFIASMYYSYAALYPLSAPAGAPRIGR